MMLKRFRLYAPISAMAIVLGVSLSSCDTTPTPYRDYEQARGEFWRSLYPQTAHSLYCRTKFNTQQRRGFNVEHVFPMSWVTNALACGKRKQCRSNNVQFNLIEADLHNLYPATVEVNRARSSFRFGEIPGEARRFGKDCDFEVNPRARVAEPALEVRGEVARSMFYMANQYKNHGLIIFKAQAKMLGEWHTSDPPSLHEKQRNDQIEKMQGNRNPFIDDPAELTRLLASGHFE